MLRVFQAFIGLVGPDSPAARIRYRATGVQPVRVAISLHRPGNVVLGRRISVAVRSRRDRLKKSGQGAGAQAPITPNSGVMPAAQVSYWATGTHRYASPSASTDQKQ